ncbi:MAG: hypothetical protein ABIQ98_05760 [Sphingomicrobium sp.]
MLALAMGLAMIAADPGDNSARARFVECVKGAMDKASAAKVAPPAFADFAKQSCVSETSAFRANLIAYDVKAGWTRKKAEPDAEGQIGDALADWTDRYRDNGNITAAK